MIATKNTLNHLLPLLPKVKEALFAIEPGNLVKVELTP
jgi:hypothetical protein